MKRSETPRFKSTSIFEPVKRATAGTVQDDVNDNSTSGNNFRQGSVAHFVGSNFLLVVVLGFRCAPPQALSCHPLRGLAFIVSKLI